MVFTSRRTRTDNWVKKYNLEGIFRGRVADTPDRNILACEETRYVAGDQLGRMPLEQDAPC